MDFETSFFECCKTCNFSGENYQLPGEIQGQGDCKINIDIQDDQNIWMTADKGKKVRTKVREKVISGLKAEKQKKLQEPFCDCFKKLNKKQKYKFDNETKLGNKNSEIFEDCTNPWNFPYASWNNKADKICASEEPDSYALCNSDNILAETVVELKQKVDTLFQIFQEYGEKPSQEGVEEQSQVKATGTIFENFWHLFDFNKRLSATEEGIEKLTLIIEDLLKKCIKEKPSSPDGMKYSSPLPFEEMPIGERINFLKTRNDLLLGLMKDFLKVSSVEEICSRLALLPKNSKADQVFLRSELHNKEKNQANCLSREEVIDTLKSLRMQFTKIQENKSQKSDQLHTIKNERRGENTLKYFGSKLEVISEQAELVLNSEGENTNLDEFEKKNGQNLKENLPEVNEESEERDVNAYEDTSRLLAQEAFLKSSLDKVRSVLFSKLDSSEKNHAKGSSNLNHITEISTDEENQKDDLETNFNSSGSPKAQQATSSQKLLVEKNQDNDKVWSSISTNEGSVQHINIARDFGCIYCDTEYAEKSKCNEGIAISGKYGKHKESAKEKNYSIENISEIISKQNNPAATKKADEHKNFKPKSVRKAIQKNSFTITAPCSKPKRIGNYLPERCSSSREGTKNEIEAKDKRPVTAPNSNSKVMPPSGLKTTATEKIRRKNLELNNVENKNKILLSKKSFVGTS